MINFQSDAIDRFVAELRNCHEETYGRRHDESAGLLGWMGHLALENIANSDALYHNVEHTMMVTLVGQEILRGKHLRDGCVSPRDWLHFIVACLCHDIGYVRGVCRNDVLGHYDDGFGRLVEFPGYGTDAALTAIHVDRSKLFVRERFSNLTSDFDVETVCAYIEKTRFNPADLAKEEDGYDFPALTRAADFIGQLGDPGYLRKIPALFYEFAEIGAHQKLGYENPEQMRTRYAKFFWQVVSPHIQGALHYLGVTQRGKQWIASLYAHVFAVEHRATVPSVRMPAGMIFE
jgi:hypothetical protein